MTKAELISHLAAETSTTGAAAERTVGAVFSVIVDALARDEPVAIAGFGKLAARGRAARQGSVPRTGEPVAVPASKDPSFKLAIALREAVYERHDRTGHHMLAIRLGNAPTASFVADHRTAMYTHSTFTVPLSTVALETELHAGFPVFRCRWRMGRG